MSFLDRQGGWTPPYFLAFRINPDLAAHLQYKRSSVGVCVV